MDYKITDEEINKVKLNSPFALPNSPTERGMKPEAIKEMFWKPFAVLTEFINKYLSALGDEMATDKSDIDSLQNGLSELVNRLDEAFELIEAALENAANASTNAQTVLAKIPKTFFESTFQNVVGAALSPTNNIKNGDVFINVEKDSPDFIVFKTNQFDEKDLIVLKTEMVANNTLPTPSPGDKYLLEIIKGEKPQFGIVAIESGLNAPMIAIDNQLSLISTNPVQNKIVTAALNEKLDKSALVSTAIQGSTDPITSGGVREEFRIFSISYDDLLGKKQDKLVQGENITIDEAGVISSTVDVSGKLDKRRAPTGYIQAYVATPYTQTMVDIKLDNQGGLKGDASLVTGNAVALEIEEAVGYIKSDLTELHDYAQSLKGGDSV